MQNVAQKRTEIDMFFCQGEINLQQDIAIIIDGLHTHTTTSQPLATIFDMFRDKFSHQENLWYIFHHSKTLSFEPRRFAMYAAPLFLKSNLKPILFRTSKASSLIVRARVFRLRHLLLQYEVISLGFWLGTVRFFGEQESNQSLFEQHFADCRDCRVKDIWLHDGACFPHDDCVHPNLYSCVN